MPSLVQTMACRLFNTKPLTKPSWFIVIWSPSDKFQSHLNQNTINVIQKNLFQNVGCKMAAILYPSPYVYPNKLWKLIFQGFEEEMEAPKLGYWMCIIKWRMKFITLNTEQNGRTLADGIFKGIFLNENHAFWFKVCRAQLTLLVLVMIWPRQTKRHFWGNYDPAQWHKMMSLCHIELY